MLLLGAAGSVPSALPVRWLGSAPMRALGARVERTGAGDDRLDARRQHLGEADDSEGRRVEFDFLLVVVVRSVIGRDRVDRSVRERVDPLLGDGDRDPRFQRQSHL